MFVWFQLRTAIQEVTGNSEERQRTRALDYIRRWNESSDQAERIPLYAFCRDATKGEAEKLAILNSDHKRRALLRADCNFFEELGIADARDLMDRDVAFEFFGMMVPETYNVFRFYIEHRKDETKNKSAEKLFKNFSTLEENYRKRIAALR